MDELNEQELERITGGEGEGETFSRTAWARKNCRDCANNSTCQNRPAYMISAKQKAEKGMNNDCPFKC